MDERTNNTSLLPSIWIKEIIKLPNKKTTVQKTLSEEKSCKLSVCAPFDFAFALHVTLFTRTLVCIFSTLFPILSSGTNKETFSSADREPPVNEINWLYQMKELKKIKLTVICNSTFLFSWPLFSFHSRLEVFSHTERRRRTLLCRANN